MNEKTPNNIVPLPIPPAANEAAQQQIDTAAKNIDFSLSEEQEQQLKLIFDRFEEKFLTILQIDKLENNSLIFFKVDPDNVDFIMSLPIIAKKYEPQFREKNIGIVITGPKDGVEVINEKQMEKLGWQKKEKSLIITPDQF